MSMSNEIIDEAKNTTIKAVIFHIKKKLWENSWNNNDDSEGIVLEWSSEQFYSDVLVVRIQLI